MPARTAALHRGVHGLRAAIPAGGGRCRKDRFLRSPPLPSPVLTLTSAQGAGGTLGSPPGGSWGPGLQGTCPPGPGRGRAGRAACCSGRRPGAGVVGGVKPRPPLLPFAGYGFQAGHLIHNPPPNRVREEHHPLPSRRSSLGPGCVEDARALGACVSPQGAGGKVESTCAHTQAASQLASGLLSSEPVLAYPSLSPRSLLDWDLRLELTC